jgi:hypothetical protein
MTIHDIPPSGPTGVIRARFPGRDDAGSALRDAVGRAAPRPVLLVAGAGEEAAARHIAAGAPASVEVWEAGTGHTDALAERPEAWERRVVAFLDRHLASAAHDAG